MAMAWRALMRQPYDTSTYPASPRLSTSLTLWCGAVRIH